MSDHPTPRPMPGPGSFGQRRPDPQAAAPADDPSQPAQEVADPVDGGVVGATGHPEVDAVLASLADLDGRPVAEHVSVFEDAHDRLRGALADAGNDPAGA
ncbi:hypothetical protein KRR39_10935 [Nocardioides panacis]|uniref:Uncharacterized protein n=1 Tax=Nocardioides panacis TaxID=2849501 RepID=A0A975T2H7_9ACTN|nr:hypothetical protein [Nocardioides panacis]QWZ10197.1 hypothetical protein KRR39_10935 [Nocardioides panacis]